MVIVRDRPVEAAELERKVRALAVPVKKVVGDSYQISVYPTSILLNRAGKSLDIPIRVYPDNKTVYVDDSIALKDALKVAAEVEKIEGVEYVLQKTYS